MNPGYITDDVVSIHSILEMYITKAHVCYQLSGAKGQKLAQPKQYFNLTLDSELTLTWKCSCGVFVRGLLNYISPFVFLICDDPLLYLFLGG